jgi:hypothetical protein
MGRMAFWAHLSWKAGLSLLAAILAVLTILTPDWIEVVFHVDPDAGEGWLEVALTVATAGIALASGLGARRDWRLRAARLSPDGPRA